MFQGADEEFTSSILRFKNLDNKRADSVQKFRQAVTVKLFVAGRPVRGRLRSPSG
jgi:hypothetical protein